MWVPPTPKAPWPEAYDPYIPRYGSAAKPTHGPPQGQGNVKTAVLQAQIDDTVEIMRDNINKVTERQERLSVLENKTADLAGSSQNFRRGANRVRKNMWWKDMKMYLIIGTAIVLLIVIIVLSVLKGTHHNK
ncbi:synaptobrevin-like protein [Mycena rebaudengoi]|nr:synaptobrevin-like protein [Mycena rebaudengoi]